MTNFTEVEQQQQEDRQQAMRAAQRLDGAIDLAEMRKHLIGRRTAKDSAMLEAGRRVSVESVIRENPLLQGLDLSDFQEETERKLYVAKELLKKGGYSSIKALLPLFLSLKGRPFNLRDQFAFEPLFSTRLPKSIVIKSGRQVGKCVAIAGKAKTWLANGERRSGFELQPGDQILTADTQRNTVSRRVLAMTRIDAKPCLRIQTQSGVELLVAETHQIQTSSGWQPASQLKTADRIQLLQAGGVFQQESQHRSRVLFMGWFLGQNKAGSHPSVYPSLSRDKRKWLQKDNCLELLSTQHRIPSWVFALPAAQTLLFISAFWGQANSRLRKKNQGLFSVISVSQELLFDLRSLLLKFGISSAIQTVEEAFERQMTGLAGQPGYTLTVTDKGSQHRLKQLLEGVALPPVERSADWDRVVSIEPAGVQDCWDIEVEQEHSYALEGLITHNSTGLAAQGVLSSNCLPHFNTLYILPLFEMVRRFSNNYVKPFVETSPIGRLLNSQQVVQSVLERSFYNHAKMQFSFAYLSAERTRGVSADRCGIDEVQDIEKGFLPIIYETMSGSIDWALRQSTGTPKTMDGTLEYLWQESSQAEWIIKCHRGGCGHWNIPADGHDLIAMIGPVRDDISDDSPGLVCARCQKPLRPRPVDQGGFGRWYHRYPEKRWTNAGFHIPQMILPHHYGNMDAWGVMNAKLQGKGNTPKHVFLNEVCGESSDFGARLITLSHIHQAASLPWGCNVQEALPHIGNYLHRIVSVDWGGGGRRSGLAIEGQEALFSSYTVVTVMGMEPSGKIDVIYAYRSTTPHDFGGEADRILQTAAQFNCSHIAHDFTGAGAAREHILVEAGFPSDRIVPVAYTGPTVGGLLSWKPASATQPRSHYTCDKTRSLQATCELYRQARIRTFRDDYNGPSDPGLLRDFLALKTEKSDRRTGRDLYTIYCDPRATDDFAQAVNIGTMVLHQITGRWPELTANFPGHDQDLVASLNPFSPTMKDWSQDF